ncbi:hypothetical protein M409DRAFT_49878 [Zasmidium cellare ATCC 36951]|uniref:Uncharacterized protein n=1 Tax=Zasmidium cellare ATCC 36951 TaxID=1080233 RepID=A0A6A6D394_ZASCE|nr:uncharacterized protein M409DRAFT_49878 [Zasmidium cellare ATCC 36951]KAF2172136.1 hypothetical protein M409DRAFT_49878 [Zasmidium cellare ATCC 36951]
MWEVDEDHYSQRLVSESTSFIQQIPMSATPELDISLLTHSSVSIPSSLDSQSTAVSIKHTTSYSELRGDDDDFQAAIAKFDSVSTIKPTFNVTPSLEPSDSQASLLDRHASTPSEHSTWLRRPFQQRQRQQVTADGNSWQPSFRRTGPLLGLTALGFILLTIPASSLVLALSNGKPVDQWRVQPSVYISVLTGIGNKPSALPAFKTPSSLGGGKPKHLSMLTVTSICACVIFLDGILLQSATYTVEQNLQKPVMLRAKLSPEIPTNYTATGALLDAGNPYLDADFSSGIHPVRKQWTDELPIPSPLRGCEVICTSKVRAPALASAGCQEESNSWLNFTEIKEIRDMATLPSGCQQRWNNIRCQMFELHVYPSAASGAWERVEISYGRFMPVGDVNQDQCAGNLT